MLLMISSGISLVLMLLGVVSYNADQMLVAWISFCTAYICWHIDGLKEKRKTNGRNKNDN